MQSQTTGTWRRVSKKFEAVPALKKHFSSAMSQTLRKAIFVLRLNKHVHWGLNNNAQC